MDALIVKASELCGTTGTTIEQDDTFFVTEKGRLKLRVFKDGQGELIFYDRPDTDGPKLSDYATSVVGDPDSMRRVLGMTLGIKGQVKKTRLLFMYGRTRIHVDQVHTLGNFMELEVMLDDEESVEEGSKVADDLLDKLGIPKENLISGAYLDKLNARLSS